MRQLLFALACTVLLACEDILPVENVDLCEGDQPSSAECDQCKRVPTPQGCPQCRGAAPDPNCENAIPQGGNGGSAVTTSGASGGGKAGDPGNGGLGGGGAGAGGIGDSGSGSSGSGGGADGGMSGSGDGGSSSAGSGGSAGSAPPKCTSNVECSVERPLCNLTRGTCVACTNNGACADRASTPRCDGRSGSPTRGQCVECTGNSGCSAPEKPTCGEDSKCTACTGDDGCTSHEGTPRCDTTTGSPTKGQCFQCLSNADCPDLGKPQCTDHVCTPCTSDDACANRPNATKCNLYDGAEKKGSCVLCTGDNEAVCSGSSCKRSQGTCTNTPLASVGLCEPCEADSECDAAARCVAQTYAGRILGPYCFYVDSTTVDCATMANATSKPYSVSTPGTSIDHAPGPFCMPITSCRAVLDASDWDGQGSGAKACAQNEDCGEASIDEDGYCLASKKCSYVCTEDFECPGVGLTFCKGTSPSKSCQP